MPIEIKRVVTRVDEAGTSVFAEQTPLSGTELAMMPGAEFYGVWGADQPPSLPVTQPAPTHLPFFPPGGGTRFGIFRLPPEPDSPPEPPDEAAAAELAADAQAKLPGLVDVFEPDAPGMHRTASVDYCVVLEGELFLELDDGAEVHLPAGSCVVQNGTRHAWHNRGDVPATLAYVILGA